MAEQDQKKVAVATVVQRGRMARDASPSHQQGNVLSQLFREHSDSLRVYIARRFGAGPPEPEEVTQAAFARMAGAAALASISNPRAFLYTIACNIVIDHRRRTVHRDASHHDILLHTDADALSGFSPERVLLAKEQFAIFEAALKKMPAMRRRIFLMVRSEGRSTAEVARQFTISESGVHKHVSRALADCAAAFAKADRKMDPGA